MPPEEQDRPRLVPLEPRPVTLEDGSPAVALRDPLGVIDEVAVVSPAAYVVLAHFDGRRTPREVERALALRGRTVPLERIVSLARRLQQAGLVHGPAYQAAQARALAEYRGAPARPPACAGGAYPSDAQELRRTLDALFRHPDGPGGPPAGSRGEPLRLLVSPHIDYHRGGPSYAHAYRALAEASEVDLLVVFGTAHASPPHLFTLTRQSYGTPLGVVHTDRGLVDALASELGEEELLGDELVHRAEHSVELQMVWLRHIFADRAVETLPVLCSSISHLEDPVPHTERFLATLARVLAGRRVCYVAGADLAHVGPQFGDPAAPTPQELAALAAEDRRTLSFVSAGDAPGFRRDALRYDERRRLCGVAPIYAALRMAGSGARLLHYGQWSDGTDSVSFAAAAG
jgi:MEMO1 family protein